MRLLRLWTQEIEPDTSAPPPWSGQVERWYQLDAPAHALVETYWRVRTQLLPPSLIVLSSPGASNQSDAAFVESGMVSAHKFAHTLPNIRAQALAQVMDWEGPVLCVQKDPATVLTALTQATEFVGPDFPQVWVVGTLGFGLKRPVSTFIFEIKEQTGLPAPETFPFSIEEGTPNDFNTDDRDLWSWVREKADLKPALALPNGMTLQRRGFRD